MSNILEHKVLNTRCLTLWTIDNVKIPCYSDKMPKKQKPEQRRCFEGVIKVIPRGVGYIEAPDDSGEIKIEPVDLNTALNNDLVRISIRARVGDKTLGEVTEIITRAKTEFVGLLEKENEIYFLSPQDPRMYTNIIIPKKKLGNAKVGQKVLVLLSLWEDPKKNPVGEVKEVIGQAGAHETEIKAIALEKGFALKFPQQVEREAWDVKNKYHSLFAREEKKRRDFRGVKTFTIDPKEAKDFDDALSIRAIPDGNIEVGIHIADVGVFVRHGTALDKDAARRSTSVYLVDKTIPMLPEVLSNDLCSLKPGEDKLTFSAVFHMTQKGVVVKRWFGKTIIRSQKRFTYEEAQRTLLTRRGELSKELMQLYSLAKILRKKRTASGALIFETEEIGFELDEKGKPIRIFKKERLETSKLIEDFMILANNEVARLIAGRHGEMEKTFIYRVHPLPDRDKIQELLRLMRALGYTPPKIGKRPVSADIARLLKEVQGSVHKEMFELAVLQSLEKAIYSTKNIGHFGLSLKHYTHFTSPIRRYPDLAVHRLLYNYLSGRKVSKRALNEYEALSRYASEMERTADEAQRASIKYKQTEYMAARIGKTFDGTITGVSEMGIFVAEEVTGAEGLIRMRDLPEDYYVFDKKMVSIVGKRTKRKFMLGDSVVVQVARADPLRRQIDYNLAKRNK